MPTTVSQVFTECDIRISNKIQWGRAISESNEGIYIVSTSHDPENNLGITDDAIFDNRQVDKWITKLPNFQIDGATASKESLIKRLSKFWFSDENILYIGKAPKRRSGSGIGKRVSEYYKTEIGEKGPHSGGQWLKALSNINNFYVYYGICSKPAIIERQMLDFFMENISNSSMNNLFDLSKPIPFANIRHKGDKKHGLKNQRKQ